MLVEELLAVEQFVEFLDSVDVDRPHRIQLFAQLGDISFDLAPVQLGFDPLGRGPCAVFGCLGLDRDNFSALRALCTLGDFTFRPLRFAAFAMITHRAVEGVTVQLHLAELDMMPAADVFGHILGLESQLGGLDLEFAFLVLHLGMLTALLTQALVGTLHFGL